MKSETAPANLDVLYSSRFDGEDRAWKIVVWQTLWDRYFHRLVHPADTLVDLGAGYCEFVNAAKAARRIAVDLNPETRACAAPGVEVHQVSADALGFLRDGEANVVFSSNFLEHLPDKAAVARVLAEAHRVLAPKGRLILVGPNVRYLPGQYWDYFDHHVPLTEKSVCEAVRVTGFDVTHVEARFLPYTVKSRLPRWRWLIVAWLMLRGLAGPLLGKQFLVIATRRRSSG